MLDTCYGTQKKKSFSKKEKEKFRFSYLSINVAAQKLSSLSSLPTDWQATISIVTTDGRSSNRLRNTVGSKVEVMLRYSMLKMLIADMLIRWRLSFWFESFFFLLSLSHEKSYYLHDAFFIFYFRARLWSIFTYSSLTQAFCHWTVRVFLSMLVYLFLLPTWLLAFFFFSRIRLQYRGTFPSSFNWLSFYTNILFFFFFSRDIHSPFSSPLSRQTSSKLLPRILFPHMRTLIFYYMYYIFI